MPTSDIIAIVAAVIAFLGLGFSVFCYVRDSRLKKRADEQDKELADIQLRLGELQLKHEEEAERKRSESKVEARCVTIGPKKKVIRVSNTGGTVVTNVRCTQQEENSPYAFVQDKEPYERLEPGENFDEMLLLTFSTPPKFVIVTHWVDPAGNECARENIVTW